jgi:hypothetical protein
VHSSFQGTWAVEIGRTASAQPRQKKFVKPHLMEKSRVWWHASDTPATAEKGFDKIECSFMVKALNKLRVEATFLNIIKTIYDKSIANIILNEEKN